MQIQLHKNKTKSNSSVSSIMSFKAGTLFDEKEIVWYGPPEVPKFHPDYPFGRILYESMKFKPKAVALISDDHNISVTYEELLRDSIRIAVNLRKLALNKDDIIGIALDQTILASEIILACFFNATIFHAVTPEYEQAKIEHLYGITQPKVIFCEGRNYPKIRSACSALQLNANIFTINEHIQGVSSIEELLQFSLDEESFEPRELIDGASQTIFILNTPDISSPAKAVCIPNESSFLHFLEPRENDTLMSFSSSGWATGMIYSIAPIRTGAKRVLTSKQFTPEYLVYLIEKYKINNILLSPSNTAKLVNMKNIEQADLSSLHEVYVTGGIFSSSDRAKLRKLLKNEQRTQKIFNYYGTTEIGNIAIGDTKKPKSVGKIIQGCKIRIIADNGQPLGIGEIGEILVQRGNKPWNGYYKNLEATHRLQDAELWFHTGDMGYFDVDGELFIVDRKSDIVKYRNNIYYSLSEIEQVISKLPDVIEVCAFSIWNENKGDLAAAAIVRRPASQLTENAVKQFVAETLQAEYMQLHGGVFFVKSLPKTSTGKIIRSDTKSLVLGV